MSPSHILAEFQNKAPSMHGITLQTGRRHAVIVTSRMPFPKKASNGYRC